MRSATRRHSPSPASVVYEAVASGATTIVDYYRHPGALGRGSGREIGVRAVLCGRIMDTTSASLAAGRRRHDSAVGAAMLAESLALIARWSGKADGRLRCDLAPHAPDTCGPETAVARCLGGGSARLPGAHALVPEPARSRLCTRSVTDEARWRRWPRAGLLHGQVDCRALHPHDRRGHPWGGRRRNRHRPLAGRQPRFGPDCNRFSTWRQRARASTLCTDTKSGDLFEAMRAAIASARVRGAEYEPKAPDVPALGDDRRRIGPSPR